MVIPWTFSSTFLFASKWSILRPAEKIGLHHKEVVLTFDDGPNALFSITDRLLDVLKQENIPGTFCVIGNHAREQPGLIRRIYQEGHTIALHGMYHNAPWWPGVKNILWEFDQFTQEIRQMTGLSQYACQYYRPPYGLIFPAIEKALAMNGKRLVPVTFYRHDADALPSEADGVMEAILMEIQQEQRAAIVIHECREEKHMKRHFNEDSPTSSNKHWVPQQTHQLIKKLKQDNYTFVGMDELASRIY